MWELLALILYSLQWLGVVLGVGAEAVLLVGHLAARHARRPDWLENIPAVRTVQRLGLLTMALSGAGAVLYQLATDPTVLFIPTFGFKWVLIALCAGTFWLEHYRNSAWLEGFAGATWLALFVVHSVAPIFMWVDLLFFYGIWLVVFYAIWGTTVWAMGGTPPKRGPRAPRYEQEAEYEEPAYEPEPPPQPVRRRAPPPPQQPPRPIARVAPPPPQPVAPQAPTYVPEPEPQYEEAHEAPHGAHLSLWQRLMGFFSGHHEEAVVMMAPPPAPPRMPPPPPPPMARASAPVTLQPSAIIPSVPVTRTPQQPATPKAPPPPPPAPSRLPVVEYLEIAPPGRPAVLATPPPAPAPVAQPVVEDAGYVPDYASLPGVRVMPQRPEDLAHESRAPIVQPA